MYSNTYYETPEVRARDTFPPGSKKKACCLKAGKSRRHEPGTVRVLKLTSGGKVFFITDDGILLCVPEESSEQWENL